jgi:hypothetical protein
VKYDLQPPGAEFYRAGKQPYPEGRDWRETNAGQWRTTLYETEEKSNMNNELTHYRFNCGGHHFQPPEVRCRHCGHVLPENGGIVNGKLRRSATLICEQCAWAAKPAPPAKPKKLRQGERAEGQGVFDVPALMIL